ncbi:olfactory receptor 5AR1-like [Ambystoma mexicanum]|uniref:olfactory receptor 5AR1-like n=1 Tax=Ambystoma mexicanum TaxID=8296 RepID=UPI0037E94310
MMKVNSTTVTEFILLGLTNIPELQRLLFVLFLSVYLTTLAGNIVIVMITRLDPRLHTPMYFFLGNLSFLDLCYSSVTLPKMLVDFLSKRKVISFGGCIAQLSFFISLCCTENFLLAVMAYDRYVAICRPLHYTNIMSMNSCLIMAISCWLGGFLYSLVHILCTFRLSFCGPNVLTHFFCDLPPLFELSCTDTTINMVFAFVSGGAVGFGCFLITLHSYICIVGSLMNIHSTKGKLKAFSTCSSHLTVVILFYGTILFMYFRPTSSYSLTRDRMISLMYTIATPMLNPMIYCLRNQEVKGALKKVLLGKG